MTIIYYPLEVEKKQCKIKAEHSEECINLYKKRSCYFKFKNYDDWIIL